MDQIKIGRFIAERRRAVNITQAQLAESLGVTDRAVSKWETGRSMPDSSIMLDLCQQLKISVTDLLCGEVVSMDNQNEKLEQNLLDMAKEIERKNKTIWTSMWAIMIASITAMLAGIFITAFLVPEGPWQLVSMLGICVLFLIPCFYAVKLEASVGAYKCKKCGYEIVPTYSEALGALHRGTTRRLICPNCKKRTWCKKILTREQE